MEPYRGPPRRNYTLTVPRGENLWTHEGTHINDATTGMSMLAAEDTSITFSSAAAYENALKCVEEGRARLEYRQRMEEAAKERASRRDQEVEKLASELATMKSQLALLLEDKGSQGGMT